MSSLFGVDCMAVPPVNFNYPTLRGATTNSSAGLSTGAIFYSQKPARAARDIESSNRAAWAHRDQPVPRQVPGKRAASAAGAPRVRLDRREELRRTPE